MPLVLRSLEKPDATSSSSGTGCIGCNDKNLFSEPSLLLAEVEALVLLDMTTVAFGISEAIEVVCQPFVVVVVASNLVDTLKTTSFSTTSLVPRYLGKPDATSSSCCTGCLCINGKNELFSEPSWPFDEVEVLVLLDMNIVACGIAEAIEVVSGLFVLIVVVSKFAEDFTTTFVELGVDVEV